MYEAVLQEGGWKLKSRIPLEDTSRIAIHRMKVSITPASGLLVEDRMQIRVAGPNGFAVRLNHTAKLRDVRTWRRSRTYLFGGGLLWVDLPAGAVELAIQYTIDMGNGGEQTNSGSFLETSGHVRGQYFWHAFFDFNTANDWADFKIETRIPSEYRVCTSLPQTERVEDGERITSGRTVRPTMALSLFYDRDWKVVSRRFEDVRIDFFVTPAFQPGHEKLLSEFRLVYDLLSKRFGVLPGNRFAIVEARTYKENAGWRFASNQTIIAAGNAAAAAVEAPVPMAPLAHEIAHFWTDGADGPAMNFLTEGWAVYAEGLVIRTKFGQEAARRFWKLQSDMYFLADDGKESLLEDKNNAGISYRKGAWVFRMLEDAMGSERFGKAIADFRRKSQASRAGWEALAECAQSHAPPDFDARSFLNPWVAGRYAPHLITRISGRTVTITQESRSFVLPVVVAAATPQGTERRRVWIKQHETAVVFSGQPSEVQIDPDESLLLRR